MAPVSNPGGHSSLCLVRWDYQMIYYLTYAGKRAYLKESEIAELERVAARGELYALVDWVESKVDEGMKEAQK